VNRLSRLPFLPLLRFALVGLANTVIGYGVILILHYGLGAGDIAANALGYAIGALVSYFLNKTFTFNSRRAHGQALPRFVLGVACAWLVNLAVLKMALTLWHWPAAAAQGAAVVAYTLSFYVISRYFVFPPQSTGA